MANPKNWLRAIEKTGSPHLYEGAVAIYRILTDGRLDRWRKQVNVGRDVIPEADLAGLSDRELRDLGDLIKCGWLEPYHHGARLLMSKTPQVIPSRHKVTPTKRQREAIPRNTKLYVYERDGWTCHLCGGAINKMLLGSSSDWGPSVDHITPHYAGWVDSRDNLCAAHRWCNVARGASDEWEPVSMRWRIARRKSQQDMKYWVEAN